MSIHDVRNDLNAMHVAHPQPGDYWHEMFCPIVLVIEVTGDEIRCLRKRKSVGRDHWTWDTEHVTTQSTEDFRKSILYSSMPKTFCDVIPECKHWQEFASEARTYAQAEYASWKS